MITKQQAIDAIDFHYVGYRDCTLKVGPRAGVKISITNARRNGKTQTWVTRPDDFKVPVKHGLREYAYVTQDNAYQWHTREDCPLG